MDKRANLVINESIGKVFSEIWNMVVNMTTIFFLLII
jgi:hypothetical protein